MYLTYVHFILQVKYSSAVLIKSFLLFLYGLPDVFKRDLSGYSGLKSSPCLFGLFFFCCCCFSFQNGIFRILLIPGKPVLLLRGSAASSCRLLLSLYWSFSADKWRFLKAIRRMITLAHTPRKTAFTFVLHLPLFSSPAHFYLIKSFLASHGGTMDNHAQHAGLLAPLNSNRIVLPELVNQGK